MRYPADTEVDIGANDMSGHIQYMMDNCPDTRLVIGGLLAGRGSRRRGAGRPVHRLRLQDPTAAGADSHIAAVALFGNGAAWVGPISRFSPVYADRTIELCHGADPICNPADLDTWKNNWPDHPAGAYIDAGMANQATDFVAGAHRVGLGHSPR